MYICIYIYIYVDMYMYVCMYVYLYILTSCGQTIQCVHPPHQHNGFVAYGGVRALLMLEPIECSTSTRLGA